MISFNSKKVREQLIKEGVIIICRNHRISFGITQAVFTNKKGKRELIGNVNIEYLEDSHNEDSEHDNIFLKYLTLSGFKTVGEWKRNHLDTMGRLWMNVYLTFIKVTMERL